MPNVTCPACHLASYVAAPHAARPQCPHCEADLLPALVRPGLAGASHPDDDHQVSAGAA